MPDRAEKAASQAFFRRYQNSKTLFLSMSKKIQLIDDRSLVLPLSAIL
jgi:hypothetical protein